MSRQAILCGDQGRREASSDGKQKVKIVANVGTLYTFSRGYLGRIDVTARQVGLVTMWDAEGWSSLLLAQKNVEKG